MIFENITDGRRFTDPDAGDVLIFSRLDACTINQVAQMPSLKMVLEGEEVYRIEGRSVRICAGQMLYVRGGQAVDVTIEERREAIGVCLYLDPDEIADTRAPFLRITPASEFIYHAEEFKYSVARGADRRERVTNFGGDFKRSGASAVKRLAGAHARLSLRRQYKRSELLAKLEAARAYLTEHCNRTVTLEELSAIVGLSKFYLARHFQSAYGASPMDFHRQLRVENAAKALAQAVSTDAVAESYGYSDYSSFSKAFKRHFGQAPGEYKKALSDMADGSWE